VRLTIATRWEFEQRLLLLVASQPVFGLTVKWVTGSQDPWYAPSFSRTASVVAVVVAALGAWLRLSGTSELQAHVMAARGPDVSRLVTSGIYGSIRNPLYLGSMLILGGYSLFFGWAWAAGFVLFHWLRYERVIRLEETFLLAQWGDEYAAYLNAVPRWLPRRTWWKLFSWHRQPLLSVGANVFFVFMWLGIVVSALARDLTWMIPFEIVGGALMAWRHRRRRIREAAFVAVSSECAAQQS
jgi:protein-S-isoprenylcysteine O-methyltransferase Ste14